MNRDELEQWMKDALDKQEFIPPAAGWDQLRAALPERKDRKKKALIIPLPQRRLNVAASVALCILAGSLAYYVSRNTKISADPIVQLQAAAPGQKEALTAAAPPHHIQIPIEPTVQQREKQSLPYNSVSTHDTAAEAYAFQAEALPHADSPAIRPNVYARIQSTAVPDPVFSGPRHTALNTSSFNLGIAAQFGKANVGNMRYQLGVVAHQDLSEKLYAEATVALASTEVNYVQTSSFPSVTAGSGAFNSVSSKSVEAQYGSHIFSAGIAPALGYRLSPKLALGCGMSLYRNLNPSVSLKQDGLDQAILSNQLLSESNPVSNWDAGLTGNAAYSIGSKLALGIQYRHGLSTFMYLDGQPVRNSGVNIGLKYVFGK